MESSSDTGGSDGAGRSDDGMSSAPRCWCPSEDGCDCTCQGACDHYCRQHDLYHCANYHDALSANYHRTTIHYYNAEVFTESCGCTTIFYPYASESLRVWTSPDCEVHSVLSEREHGQR